MQIQDIWKIMKDGQYFFLLDGYYSFYLGNGILREGVSSMGIAFPKTKYYLAIKIVVKA